ncbi:hypothetical protein [Streptomyces sp. CS227]|uniref:hypothetical protein n=1 Tax=Streptomyces sp. CS227 TaxID=1982763 RepID=UPI00211B5865
MTWRLVAIAPAQNSRATRTSRPCGASGRCSPPGSPRTPIARVLPCVREESEHLVPVCADLVAELLHERERITRATE